ncbi:glycosyltransferase family 39 protein, partial [Candidatus Parcubacteria bacterium]|nr:glycosyltransferase family 39 protein [Candidatus Parcubacteria bacterium]
MRALKTARPIVVILVLAAVLRFAALDSGDVISDEAFYAFRSVGYLDFLFAPDQPTPIELLNARPAWTYLSFHDAPPLAFLVQGAAFKVFGENLWGMRIAFALAGLGSVWLVYLIGRRLAPYKSLRDSTGLADEKTGLAAATVMAILTPAVWVSRIGLLESFVIFFELVAVWAFLWALDERPRNRSDHYNILVYYSGLLWVRWGLVGVAMGLAFLTKYTAFVLVPIFLGWLIWERRSRDFKGLALACALAAILFSPVIIYNVKLFQTVGHFDLQFSYLLGQRTPEWQNLMGKEEIGTWAERLKRIGPRFVDATSPVAAAAFVVAVAASLAFLWRAQRSKSQPDRFLMLAMGLVAFSFLVIGPTLRFLVTAAPWLALLMGVWLGRIPRGLVWKFAFVLAAVELAYSMNTSLLAPARGTARLAFSPLAYDRYPWGYNELEAFLEKRLAGVRPAVTIKTRYGFIDDLGAAGIARARAKGAKPLALLLIYDDSLSDKAMLWSLHRRLVYRGWPVMAASSYEQ